MVITGKEKSAEGSHKSRINPRNRNTRGYNRHIKTRIIDDFFRYAEPLKEHAIGYQNKQRRNGTEYEVKGNTYGCYFVDLSRTFWPPNIEQSKSL